MVKSIFSILGPEMIGPSSSHTAGAARLGRAAYVLAGGDVQSVVFTLYGSFAHTGKGHGTDKALLAGIMNLSPKDEHIKTAYELAKERGLRFVFLEEDASGLHPNTVKIAVTKADGTTTELVGSSIGGGNIVLTQINGVSCEITTDYPTVMVLHSDRVGVVSKLTAQLEKFRINIVTLRNSREARGKGATTVIETDTALPQSVLNALREQPSVTNVVFIDRV